MDASIVVEKKPRVTYDPNRYNHGLLLELLTSPEYKTGF